jgi:fumarate reductase subunit D
MNQVTPKPAALKAEMQRSNAPIFWLLFGGGGVLAALFGPVLVFITGIAVPSGFTLPVDLLSFERVHALAQNFIGKGFLFAVISLFAWHAAHRILCSLHDIGIHKGLMAKSACYGGAMVITLVAASSLLKLGF